MKKPIEIRRRTRPYRNEVIKRHENGKPMIIGGGVSNFIDSPEMIRRMLTELNREREELGSRAAEFHARFIVTGLLGLLKHYNVADVAKAAGVTRAALYKGLKLGETQWQPTFDLVYRVYYAFGMQLKISIIPDKKAVKKTKKVKKTP